MFLALVRLESQQGTGVAAPGAPGSRPTWTNANKVGVGTSTTSTSKVWFTLGQSGALDEVYYPALDSANTRALELIVTDGKTFAEIESQDTEHSVEVPDSAALTFVQVNTSKSGRYRIRKTYITDPARNTVLLQLQMTVLKSGPLTVFVYFDPALKNSGLHDNGSAHDQILSDSKGDVACALVSSPAFVSVSSGYVDSSNGWTDLKKDYRLTQRYASSPDGNVAQVAELPASFAKVGRSRSLSVSVQIPVKRWRLLGQA